MGVKANLIKRRLIVNLLFGCLKIFFLVNLLDIKFFCIFAK